MQLRKIILLITILLTAYATAQNRLSYETAKELLENNCSDCYGESKEGLEKGIAAMELLLSENANIPLEGQALLAESYDFMAIRHHRNDSQEREAFTDKKNEVYASLGNQVLELIESGATVDAENRALYKKILLGYASTVEANAIPVVLENVLRVIPGDNETTFMYGLSLVDLGREDEGVTKMEEAFSQAQHMHAFNQGMKLIDFYSENSRHDDAERILSLLENKNLDQDVSSLRSQLQSFRQESKALLQKEAKKSAPVVIENTEEPGNLVEPEPASASLPELEQSSTRNVEQALPNTSSWVFLIFLVAAIALAGLLVKRHLGRNSG